MNSVINPPRERFDKDRNADEVSVTTEAARFVVIEDESHVTTVELITLAHTTDISTSNITTMQMTTTLPFSYAATTYNKTVDYNITFNNLTTVQTPYEVPFSYAAIIVSAVLLIPMAVFGLLANLITLIVIAKSKTLKSLFNHLLFSLCLSDMLSALFSPLPLYRQTWGFEKWLLTQPLCKCSFAVDGLTTYVTTIHILLFATFRLISIKWPISFKKVSIRQIRIIIVCVWILGFACAFVPYWLMFKGVHRERNSNNPDANWSHCSLDPAWINEFITYYKISYPIFIYFPMASIIIICPAIGIVIKQRRFKSRTANTEDKESERRLRKKERNAILQLAFITGSFLMGYVPNTAHVVYTTNVALENMSLRVLEWNLYMLGYIFLRFSECLNPIFYNLASSKMRKESKKFLKSCFGCKPCQEMDCGGVASGSSQGQSSGSSNGVRTTNVVL
uniref:neuropeptide SIFamide receptor-like isoform X2 n=1 Tax=Styela clava TaxID=7725 RepID=UPI00193A2DE7|nr:neuropeptide SIFamide receptor-like isoform X2 [Styela clava]